MRIILVAPKTINKTPGCVSFDYGFWNFYLPLKDLGHEVRFFDTSKRGNDELEKEIIVFQPDLLFCIMTGSPYYCPDEPWKAIQDASMKGIKTFNWFCDDVWRFNDFSSKACYAFTHCSTPEKRYVERYKDIGYNSIMYATWHSNPDLYTGWRDDSIPILHIASFVGAQHGYRKEVIKKCEPILKVGKNLSFEEMIATYSNSLAGVNFSRCSQGNETQMKARPFEIAATGALIVTEYTDNFSFCFDYDECRVVKSVHEFKDMLEWVFYNQKSASEIAAKGHDRFLRDHTSQIRMKQVLEFIG